MPEPKRFQLCSDPGCARREHFHRKEWDAYWNALTEAERESIREKSRQENMTLSAVAIEWGAVDMERK